MNNTRARLRVQVPIALATEIAQKGIGAFGPESPEVLPGVRVVQMWNNYTDYYGYKPLCLVVQWGGRYFENVDEYCYMGGDGDIVDPDEIVFDDHHRDAVEFKEVFPEVVERTIYR